MHDWTAQDGTCAGEGVCPGCEVDHAMLYVESVCETCGAVGEHESKHGSHTKDSFNSDGACKVAGCSYTLAKFQEDCGKRVEGHDWSNKNGICKDCAMACPDKANHANISTSSTCQTCGAPGTKSSGSSGGWTPVNPTPTPGGTPTPGSTPTPGATPTPDSTPTPGTTPNPDDPIITTVVKPDGTMVSTTVWKDGSSAIVTILPDGVRAHVMIDAAGNVQQTDVIISKKAEDAAAGDPITLPIDAVAVTRTPANAQRIIFESESHNAIRVAIPTDTTSTPSTVVMVAHPDGSTEVLKTSCPTKTGIVATVPGTATIIVVDNQKSFADVSSGAWYANAVAFTSARELFAGTSETRFSPSNKMTRGMMMTVLARFYGADLSGGTTWYQKGMEWAKANGISDGTNPTNNITREQLIVMVWRSAGSPASTRSLANYKDANQVSSWAKDAMSWAVENHIIVGYGNGKINPKGQATRAEVAQILQNLISSSILY